MTEHDPLDERLVRLLGATRATADPAVLVRARARLAGAAGLPRPLAWLATPAALVTACALFVAVAGVSITLVRGEGMTASSDTALVSALLGDDGSYGLPTATASRAAGVTTDSGAVNP